MPLLSLAHFTVVEAEPITLIEAAQAGGYDAIGLRILPLFPTDHVFPVIGNPNLVRSIKRRLMETGIRALDSRRSGSRRKAISRRSNPLSTSPSSQALGM